MPVTTNPKMDAALGLALNVSSDIREKSQTLEVGFDEDTRTWEVIVKYHGNLEMVADEVGAVAEILNENYAILTVPEDRIRALADYPEIEFVEKPKRLGIALDNSLRAACITPIQNLPPFELRGQGVLLGIIDSGIDYSHPDFINPDGTSRILYIWDQTIPGNPPKGFAQGTEYTQAQINEALGILNPMERRRFLPHEDSIGHGTHVAGIAGGNGRASGGRYMGVAPEAEFIIVKLGRTGIESFPRTTELMRALKYMVDKAESLQQPIAINISFGTNDGPHDGRSLIESYINDMSSRWKNAMVVATGNEGAAGHHTGGILSPNETREIQFMVGQELPSLSLEVWKSFADEIDFALVSPGGTSSGRITARLGEQRIVLDDTEVFLYMGEPTPINGDQQIFIEITPVAERLSEGIWTLILYGGDIVLGNYDIWLPITEIIGTQTAFTQPTLPTTLTIPSTVERVISVGAYDARTNSIAPFSGRGYTRNNTWIKPDLVAPGVNITAAAPRGGYDALSGTSMAAPHVTGAAALMMQWGIVQGNDPFLYGEKLKAYLRRGARRDQPFVEYPNNAWGFGSLCLENALRFFRSRQVEADTRQENQEQQAPTITEKIISNDYMDLLIEYPGEIERIAARFEGICEPIDDRFAVLHISQEEMEQFFREFGNVVTYQAPLLFGPVDFASLNASDILPLHNHPYVELRGNGVLVGIIDTGIDYSHPAFLYEDNTTRIKAIWDQTIQGNPPEGFCYGTEFTEEDINVALRSEDPFVVVPERDLIGHGTFLAGVAAGNDRITGQYVGAAPDAELLVVKLKPAKQYLREVNLIGDPETAVYQSNDVITAIKYLSQKAAALGRPIAINLGLGGNQGGHDGTSVTETYMASIGGRRGVVIVVAAGNEGNAAHHTTGILTEEQPIRNIELRVGEGETGFSLYIWAYAPDKISVAIASPTGEFVERVPAKIGEVEEAQLVMERTNILIEYFLPEVRTGDQLISIRFRDPTPGNWTIRLYGDVIVDGRFHAWLPRRGWVDPETVFLQPVPYTTVTVPSTTIGVITVGAYNHINNSLFIESGRGPTRDGELKPDLVAPGVRVTGPLPGNQYGQMTGTSVAAAQVAGASALLLEWGIILGNDPDMRTRKVRTYLIRGAVRREGLDYPNPDWGYGQLNLLRSIQMIRSKENDQEESQGQIYGFQWFQNASGQYIVIPVKIVSKT